MMSNNNKKKPAIRRQHPIVNVFKIFIEDQRNLFRSVIGIVVAMGLVIVPSMYAWFNIAASWDPYGNTSKLRVAVANTDKGYSSDLISMPVNMGNNVESSLRKNTKLDWQFVSKKKAIDGVHSGSYYAAIVIPEDFSAHMLTFFEANSSTAKIEYYINEKSNAIAPKITEKAADTVVTQISETFAQTIASIALDVAHHVSDFSSSAQGQEYVDTVVKRLNTVANDMDAAAVQMGSYAALIQASADLVSSSQAIISAGSSGSADVRAELNNAVKKVKNLSDAASSAGDSLSSALDSEGTSLDAVLSQLDALSSPIGANVDTLSTRLTNVGNAIQSSADSYSQIISALEQVKAQVSDPITISNIDALIAQLQQASSDVTAIGLQVSAACTNAAKAKETVEQQKKQLAEQVRAVKKTLTDAKNSFNVNVKPQLSVLVSDMNTVSQRAQTASNSVRAVLGSLRSEGTQARSTVKTVSDALSKTRDALTSSASSLRAIATSVQNGVDETNEKLSDIAGNDLTATQFAAMLSSPVKLKRHAVFAVANYGTAMSAFYTILAIWVGSVFLVSMMKISVSDRRKARVLGLASADELYAHLPKNSGSHTAGNASLFGLGLGSEYWGRYLTFLVFSLLQSTLLVMGDLWYLKIQCDSPLLLFLAAWCASLLFSTLMYALTLALGAVGKAIAVIIMVMQIAGSGGTFPVELMPAFFQWVYPLLPFRYGMKAMHAAIAGAYGNEYWVALGQFMLFMIPALLIGLIVARPLVKSDVLMEQLAKTGVYGE
ncbi:YhgE/Pip domain-containing protein [Alloscardovia omnicolens]|uniref:YhgE/Pip domain-containing protein n=1 Tax=Alloscardovia omnicolens TaxID=419015 RepID=UPI00254EED6F|nr:YhgE/Pip domain-containing protein [Alloscardovia omnicolens]MDK6250054.1 YhgE/Pip domain-containing protein [Alloscardovia omnicolens]